MSNENVLSNMRCPKCGSFGPFNIEATTSVKVHDDGTDECEGFEWDDYSACNCPSCGYNKTVSEFTLPPMLDALPAVANGMVDALRIPDDEALRTAFKNGVTGGVMGYPIKENDPMSLAVASAFMAGSMIHDAVTEHVAKCAEHYFEALELGQRDV